MSAFVASEALKRTWKARAYDFGVRPADVTDELTEAEDFSAGLLLELRLQLFRLDYPVAEPTTLPSLQRRILGVSTDEEVRDRLLLDPNAYPRNIRDLPNDLVEAMPNVTENEIKVSVTRN